MLIKNTTQMSQLIIILNTLTLAIHVHADKLSHSGLEHALGAGCPVTVDQGPLSVPVPTILIAILFLLILHAATRIIDGRVFWYPNISAIRMRWGHQVFR